MRHTLKYILLMESSTLFSFGMPISHIHSTAILTPLVGQPRVIHADSSCVPAPLSQINPLTLAGILEFCH